MIKVTISCFTPRARFPPSLWEGNDILNSSTKLFNGFSAKGAGWKSLGQRPKVIRGIMVEALKARVHYVPGSHRWNLLPIAGLASDMNSIQSVLTEVQKREFKPVAIELKKRCASFHHPLMVHGSFENSTDVPRRAVVLNVFRDGVVSNSDLPPLDGVPPVPKGEPMQGQFFPLLFDPSEI